MVSGGTAVVGYRRQVKDEWVSMEFPTTIIFISFYNFLPRNVNIQFEAKSNKKTFEYCLEFFAPLDHYILGQQAQFMRPNP